MTLTVTLEKLRGMKMCTMAESLTTRLDRGEQKGLTHEDFISLFVDDEYLHRKRCKLERLQKNAKFKLNARLEEIDYEPSRGIKKTVLLEFTKQRWIDNAQNTIISGATGVGKTFIACAIGNEACRMGFSVLYIRAQTLLQNIFEMKGTGNYIKFMGKLAKFKVLIIDDLGLAPLNQEATEDIMEIIEARDLCTSTIITSQLPKKKIYTAFAEPTLADAICDRLFRGCIDINMKGESRRKNPSKN